MYVTPLLCALCGFRRISFGDYTHAYCLSARVALSRDPRAARMRGEWVDYPFDLSNPHIIHLLTVLLAKAMNLRLHFDDMQVSSGFVARLSTVPRSRLVASVTSIPQPSLLQARGAALVEMLEQYLKAGVRLGIWEVNKRPQTPIPDNFSATPESRRFTGLHPGLFCG